MIENGSENRHDCVDSTSSSALSVLVESFYDPVTGTITHVAHNGYGSAAAVIDPVLDYDPKAGRTSTRSVEGVAAFIVAHSLSVQWILETHAHADHVSAAQWLRARFGGKVAIGASICLVQSTFARIFNLRQDFKVDGSQFDYLFQAEEEFNIGALSARAMHVPGHTPADMAYQIGNVVFVGDTLFMPDLGTARCDFPGGDAEHLYSSVRRLLSFPAETRLFMCHDYPPEGRAPQWECTVEEQRKTNIHIHDGIGAAQFFTTRTTRDATLEMPTLIFPAIQINIRAGVFPPPENNGSSYLKIPINML